MSNAKSTTPELRMYSQPLCSICADQIQAQVSWQSAFWGLAPLAINAMVQPAGKVCDAPRAIGPLMRASPIICFLDMLSIIIRSAVYGIRKRSFKKGCTLVMTQRYANDHESARSALSEFKYSSPIRWISFLASLSQVVKLFAFEGLVWTKVWAAMYLAFFLTVEIHVLMSKRWLSSTWPLNQPAHPEDIPRPHGFRSLPYISVALGVVFSVFFMIKAAALAVNHRDRPVNTTDCTGIILLVCSIAIFVPPSYYSYMTRGDRKRGLRAQISLAVVLLVPAVYLLALVQHATIPLAPQVSNYLTLGLILIWALASLSWASATFSKADLAYNDKRRIENSLAPVFFILNVASALLYYRFGYNPAGTVKPAWTENLG